MIEEDALEEFQFLTNDLVVRAGLIADLSQLLKAAVIPVRKLVENSTQGPRTVHPLPKIGLFEVQQIREDALFLRHVVHRLEKEYGQPCAEPAASVSGIVQVIEECQIALQTVKTFPDLFMLPLQDTPDEKFEGEACPITFAQAVRRSE